MFNSMIFLQAAQGNDISQFIFIGAIIAVFYLFIMRPQMKKQKEQREFTSTIKKGDEIVTSSGIVGKINKIEGKYMIIESSKSFIKVLSSSVSKEMTESVNEKPAEKKKGLFGFGA